jgi:predicted amidophosphoribosyltransferase
MAVFEVTPENQQFLAGFIVFLVILLIALYLILQARAKKRSVMPGKDEVKCPNCNNFVRHDAPSCKHCGAEFVKDEFECPECHETLHFGAKRCKRCGHSFEEKKEFVCPKCGEPVDKDAKKCPKCKEEFWAPVRPPSTS